MPCHHLYPPSYTKWLHKALRILKNTDNMEKEIKANKEFVWTDELVKELIIRYNNIRNSIAGADLIKKEIVNFKKSKEKEKPLFIADDGVGIYLDDVYYQVLADWSVKAWRSDFGRPNDAIAAFSTGQAAKEYVLMNQRRYNITDIYWIHKNWLGCDELIDFKDFLISKAK